MKIDANKLHECALAVLLACGESKEGAHTVADSMVKADSRGIVTHGTYLLTPIYKRCNANQLALPTNVTVVKDDGAAAVLDGGDGLGAVAGKKAVDMAVEKAKNFGVSTVLIRNTNNVGSLAYYTEMAAKQGAIAFMCCNAAPAMAPWGGAEQFMGTNPTSLAVFTGADLLFSSDMASSVVARGKIRKASRNGQSIPDNWALDQNGAPTTDPDAALKGCLLPMGGPKGSAIGLVVDILSGMLSGSSFAPNLKSFHAPEGSTGVGACLSVVDIKHYMPLKQFTDLIGGYIDKIHSLRKAKGVNQIFIPGEIEQNKEKSSRGSGIELDGKAAAAIDELLEAIGSNLRLQ